MKFRLAALIIPLVVVVPSSGQQPGSGTRPGTGQTNPSSGNPAMGQQPPSGQRPATGLIPPNGNNPGAGNQNPPRGKTERRKRADEKADARNLFTIEGKVKPADVVDVEEDMFGRKQRVVWEEEVREAVIGDVVEFERPNLASKWAPNPITPADVGCAYLVQRVWSDGGLVMQPRLIAKDGTVTLGKPVVIKGCDVTGLKPRMTIPMEGKYKISGLNKNKSGTVFFELTLERDRSKDPGKGISKETSR